MIGIILGLVEVFIVHLSVYIVLVDPHEELVKFKNTFCVGKRSLLRTILIFRVQGLPTVVKSPQQGVFPVQEGRIGTRTACAPTGKTCEVIEKLVSIRIPGNCPLFFQGFKQRLPKRAEPAL